MRTAAAVATLVLAVPVLSQTVRPPAAEALLASWGSIDPLPGWTALCARRPASCTIDLSEPSTIALTPRLWSLLAAVNRAVNGAIRPREDQELWAESDRWALPQDGYGDCEDYQLLKRQLLVKAGLPARALRMTVVLDEEHKGHAVLMVRTVQGDFILDNRRDAVLPWHRTPYIFIKRESDVGAAWVSLGGTASPAAPPLVRRELNS